MKNAKRQLLDNSPSWRERPARVCISRFYTNIINEALSDTNALSI